MSFSPEIVKYSLAFCHRREFVFVFTLLCASRVGAQGWRKEVALVDGRPLGARSHIREPGALFPPAGPRNNVPSGVWHSVDSSPGVETNQGRNLSSKATWVPAGHLTEQLDQWFSRAGQVAFLTI